MAEGEPSPQRPEQKNQNKSEQQDQTPTEASQGFLRRQADKVRELGGTLNNPSNPNFFKAWTVVDGLSTLGLWGMGADPKAVIGSGVLALGAFGASKLQEAIQRDSNSEDKK